jgi:enoyl-CoA hydratase
MAYENILVEKEGAVAVVTVNRPKVLNALNPETLRELLAAFVAIEDDADVAVAILTGAGDKAFVAGADISRMPEMTPLDGLKFAQLGQLLSQYMEGMGKPIIAAVNGFALGGGTELAMACDFIYAAKTARFGQPEINLGILPGFGGTQRLPRLIGLARAKELDLTGDQITADEAYRIGLVNKVVDGDVLAAAKETASKIAGKGRVAVALIKGAMNRGMDVDLKDALYMELQAFGLVCSTQDKNEGTRAFLEKRKPNFQGK